MKTFTFNTAVSNTFTVGEGVVQVVNSTVNTFGTVRESNTTSLKLGDLKTVTRGEAVFVTGSSVNLTGNTITGLVNSKTVDPVENIILNQTDSSGSDAGSSLLLDGTNSSSLNAGNNITIQAKNTLYLGPGKKGYCKFTETTKKPNWHAICGYQENLIGRAGLGLRAESLFNVAAAAATGGIGGPLATAAVSAATEMGVSAVSSFPGAGVVSAATGAVSAVTGGGGLGDLASSALGGGDLVGAVTKGAGIVGAATNVLRGGGLAPGALVSNVAGQVVGDNVGSLVGTAGEVLGSPAPLASMAELDAELARAQAGDRSGLDEALDF